MTKSTNTGKPKKDNKDISVLAGAKPFPNILTTNGVLQQQTGRWHRLQNKFAKVWEQTKVTARRLVVSYFN